MIGRLALSLERAADGYRLMARIQAVRLAEGFAITGADEAIAKRLDGYSLAYDAACAAASDARRAEADEIRRSVAW